MSALHHGSGGVLGPPSSLSSSARDRCVIFLHIPRTAGQTLNSIIARCYRRGEVFTCTGPLGQQVAIPETREPSLRLIKGHLYYGIHEQFDIPCTYFTFLRDPVGRVTSLYRYAVANPKHPVHGSVGHMSFEEFVTSGIDDLEVENGQTRQLSGIADRPADDRMLEAAKQNLESRFALVGITERFDESLLLLRQALGWPLPFYRVRNTTKTARDDLSLEARLLVEARNALDLELYRFALDLLEKRLAEQGPLFPVKLVMFRVLNGAAQVYRSVLRGAFRSSES